MGGLEPRETGEDGLDSGDGCGMERRARSRETVAALELHLSNCRPQASGGGCGVRSLVVSARCLLFFSCVFSFG